jgi:hypothetical protein
VTEKDKNVIYLVLQKALYICIKSALLFSKNLSGKHTERGYMVNPYDLCVANKTLNGLQITIVWHADDIKISHIDEATISKEIQCLEGIYGPFVGSTGKTHTYLGIDMPFDNELLK